MFYNIPMKISVIIPCYNEVQTIGAVVEAVRNSPLPDKEIIIVDDASTDGTTQKLKAEIEGSVDKVIYHERNKGKGAAIRTGVKEATGDIVIIQDADLEYDPAEYERVIEPIITNKADVVFGSRFVGNDAHRVLYLWHRIGNGFLTLLSNICTNLNLTDMETCYKAFRREIIQSIKIEEDRFGFEPEITAKVAQLNCRIYEVGISYNGRTYQEGKKITWKDGFRAIYCIMKYAVLRRIPREKIAVLLLITASLFSGLQMLKSEAWRYYGVYQAGAEDDLVRRQEKRLAGIKDMLPVRGTIGYITDQRLEQKRKTEYYVTQYILAPVIIVDDPSLPLVIGNFHRHKHARAAMQEWKVIKGSDRWILLLERGGSR